MQNQDGIQRDQLCFEFNVWDLAGETKDCLPGDQERYCLTG